MGALARNGLKTYFFRNPTAMSNGQFMKLPCMSKFGAPVPPKLVLGGFERDNYEQAQALIITFVVKNHDNEEDNKKAEAWEKEFINYLKNWEKNGSRLNLTVAFSSERSIQDEIDRASKGDVLTIVFSYLFMFAYISVGLGQFRSVSRILVRFSFRRVFKLLTLSLLLLPLKYLPEHFVSFRVKHFLQAKSADPLSNAQTERICEIFPVLPF